MNFKRIITTVLLFPLLIFLILKADLLLIFLVILLTAFLCFYEWKNLYDFSFFFWLLGELLLIVGFLVIFLYKVPVFFIFYFYFLLNYEKERFKKDFFPFLTGLIYIFIGLYPFMEILEDFKREYLVYFFSVIFANDTGAYLSGKSFGKTPFFSNISPKKTLEGFFGGLISALMVATILNYFLNLFSFNINTIIALTLSITGCMGDLLESAFKRVVDKKDSGVIIVGHGGILDRIDSVLFSSPIFWIILNLLK
jgi:phosphatidate cytidylyltransferase